MGIQTQIFRVGEFKSAVEMFTQEKMSPENRQQTRELVNDLWNHFVQIIAERRQIEPQVLNDLASDLDVLRAHQALEHKLADEPASEEQVLELLRTLSGTEKDKKLPLVSFSRYYRSTSQGFALGKPNRIAVIFASGEIISGRSSDDYVGSEDLLTAMRQISRDKEIKGLVIRVNSPGGSALASDVIWRQTLEIKKTKPVIASFGDIAASGGYYLAAGADHIFAEANTLTGSIGVFGVYFTTQDFFDKKLGVTFDRVLTHPYADVGDGSRPMTTFERKRIQSQVEQTYQQFLRVVKQGRNYQSEEEVDNVARGRVWSGLQALQQGLVDDQGGLSEALKKAAEVANLGDSWDVEVFPREKSPFEQLMMAFGDMAWVQNLLQSEHPFQDIVDLWNRMRVWQKGGGVLALNPDQIEIR